MVLCYVYINFCEIPSPPSRRKKNLATPLANIHNIVIHYFVQRLSVLYLLLRRCLDEITQVVIWPKSVRSIGLKIVFLSSDRCNIYAGGVSWCMHSIPSINEFLKKKKKKNKPKTWVVFVTTNSYYVVDSIDVNSYVRRRSRDSFTGDSVHSCIIPAGS